MSSGQRQPVSCLIQGWGARKAGFQIGSHSGVRGKRVSKSGPIQGWGARKASFQIGSHSGVGCAESGFPNRVPFRGGVREKRVSKSGPIQGWGARKAGFQIGSHSGVGCAKSEFPNRVPFRGGVREKRVSKSGPIQGWGARKAGFQIGSHSGVACAKSEFPNRVPFRGGVRERPPPNRSSCRMVCYLRRDCLSGSFWRSPMPRLVCFLRTLPSWSPDLAAHVSGQSPRAWTCGDPDQSGPLCDSLAVDEAERLVSTLPVVSARGRPPGLLVHIVLGALGPSVGPYTVLKEDLASFRQRVLAMLRFVLGPTREFAFGAWHMDEVVPHLHVLVVPVIDGKLDRRAFDQLLLEQCLMQLPADIVATLPPEGALRVRAALAAFYHRHVAADFGFSPPRAKLDPLPGSKEHLCALKRACDRVEFASLTAQLNALATAPEERLLDAVTRVLSTRSLLAPMDVPECISTLLDQGPCSVALVELQSAVHHFAASVDRAVALAQAFDRQGHVDAAWPAFFPPPD